MSKKKKWWNQGLFGNDTAVSEFPNSAKQHQRKFDEDGIEYFEGEESFYDWGWDKKLMSDKKEKQDDWKTDENGQYVLTPSGRRIRNKQEYKKSAIWDNYEKTGTWRGYEYYKQPQLSYKYVQQMANALAAQHRITVEVGNEWKVDLINKKLTYNPASLIYGTKSELLATLMHEIGKLRYSTHSSKLKSKYLAVYGIPAQEVLSNFEDVRVDFQMLRAYESAAEIYESVIPLVTNQVKAYQVKDTRFKEAFLQVLDRTYENIKQGTISVSCLEAFGTSSIPEAKKRIDAIRDYYKVNGTIYEYCGTMLSVMYDLDSIVSPFDNINDKIALTIPAIEPAKLTVESQNLVDLLNEKVYPHIESLLKELTDQNEILDKIMPELSAESKKMLMDSVKNNMGGTAGQSVNVGNDGNSTSRTSGKSKSTVPPEWMNGDYHTLKDSVSAEIRQLINKLTFLRREELTVKFQQDQKRGKLNSKKLYKTATGSKRLFKQKLENLDTIQSFAFTLLMDISGSMQGNRIVHTTRASIILSEVFKKMNIPFEFIVFNNGAKHIKKFNQELDKSIEKKIGGLANSADGGTNLYKGLDAITIKKQKEANKIVIVLSDGGVGGRNEITRLDNTYFKPWEKDGIKSVGFGIECESDMQYLCMGNSKVVNNSSQLPVEFTKLLKNIIKRK